MQSKAKTAQEYYDQLPADRKGAMVDLRSAIKKNIPKGFEECMGYGMVGFFVPHKLYPAGYHCDPKQALPFIGLASQKNFIAVYHMGIYADPKLLKWFTAEFKKHSKAKLDMGKSCIRFKKPEEIPFKLIGELATKMTTKDWITLYESAFKKGAKAK
jgi:hypothetical protein